MPVHHLAVAAKNLEDVHRFYTEAMGFELVKVVKREALGGGWTKHIFYNIGDGTLFAIWDLRGLEGEQLEADDWSGGISTGAGLPWWVNHVAFQVDSRAELDAKKQRWLDHGHHVVEVDHDFIVSIYTRDPDGSLVEWALPTRVLGPDDRSEAERLLGDDSPATEPDYEGIVTRSAVKDAARASS